MRNLYQTTQRKYFYQVWNTKNYIFCYGKCITGSENNKLIATFLLIAIPTSVFYAFILPYYHYSIILITSVLTTLVYLFMFMTVLIDPGIIPKITNDYELYEDLFEIPKKLKEGQSITIPIKTHSFKLKYCSTCLIYRPPRVSHCPSCDNCVNRFDHHCPWLGSQKYEQKIYMIGACVGRRNYKYFYFFIFTLSFLLLWCLSLSLHYMINETAKLQQKQMDTSDALSEVLKNNPASLILAIFELGFSIFVIGLTLFHTHLCITNKTTNEYIKKHWNIDSQNPFRLRNKISNCQTVLGWMDIVTFIILREMVCLPKKNEDQIKRINQDNTLELPSKLPQQDREEQEKL